MDPSPMDDVFFPPENEVPVPSEKDVGRDLRWEATVVRRLLKTYGLLREVADLEGMCYDRTGESRLLLAWFYDLHPNFPVWLGARKVPYLDEVLNALTRHNTNKFLQSELYRLYEDVALNAPDEWSGRKTGLVVEYIHSGRAMKVLHDYGDSATFTGSVWTVQEKYGNRKLYFQDFDDFLQELRWSP